MRFAILWQHEMTGSVSSNKLKIHWLGLATSYVHRCVMSSNIFFYVSRKKWRHEIEKKISKNVRMQKVWASWKTFLQHDSSQFKNCGQPFRETNSHLVWGYVYFYHHIKLKVSYFWTVLFRWQRERQRNTKDYQVYGTKQVPWNRLWRLSSWHPSFSYIQQSLMPPCVLLNFPTFGKLRKKHLSWTHVDQEIPNNCRPISPLPVSKICERGALTQPSSYLTANQRLSPKQRGNRKCSFTETSILQTTDATLEAIEKKELTATVTFAKLSIVWITKPFCPGFRVLNCHLSQPNGFEAIFSRAIKLLKSIMLFQTNFLGSILERLFILMNSRVFRTTASDC